MAFKDDRDGDPTSVYLAHEAGSPDAIMASHEGFGLVSLTAEIVQANGLGVVGVRCRASHITPSSLAPRPTL
jgi:hypothetical protein